MAIQVVVGNTYIWKLYAKKNTVVWDLTGATVHAILVLPDRSEVAYEATVTDAAAGEAEWQNAADAFAVPGKYMFYWRVVVGTIVQEHPDGTPVAVRAKVYPD